MLVTKGGHLFISIMAAKDIINNFLKQFNEKYSNGARAEMSDFYAPDGKFLSHNMKAAEGKQGIPSYA